MRARARQAGWLAGECKGLAGWHVIGRAWLGAGEVMSGRARLAGWQTGECKDYGPLCSSEKLTCRTGQMKYSSFLDIIEVEISSLKYML